MRVVSNRIVLAGITVILMADMVGVYAFEPTTGLQLVVKQLGGETDFEKTGQIFLANSQVWGKAGRQGHIAYRMLKASVEADVFVAAFDVDNKGFCSHDMILEVFYRDDIKQWTDKKRVQGTVVIKSRIDFAQDNEYVEVGHLQAVGDGKWKIARIFLERTPRQMIRAIDGSFQFKIVMPKSKACTIPISYIKLGSVTHSDLVALREKERSQRGLQRVEYEPVSGKREFSGQAKAGFVVYPVNYLELVFPNSCVDHNEVNEPLQCFEVPGQFEPVTFVIHAYEDLKNVRVVVSDLHGAGASIPSKNVDIRKVVYNDQRVGWSKSKYYCTCPDYLSPTDPKVNIKADTNCQFWLTVYIPSHANRGLYKGKVTITVKNKQPYNIPLHVEVLPVILRESKKKHMLYHSPYLKKFHADPKRVLVDMKEHGLVPIFYPRGKLIKTKGGVDIKLDDFEYQLKSFRHVYPKAEELFVGVFDYYSVWRVLGEDEPVCARPSLKFEAAYGRILRAYSDLAKCYGLELYFSFQDEPFKNIDKRRTAYYCSQIAQRNGLKTWSTQLLDRDVQLVERASKSVPFPSYTRPLREVLDIFVESVRCVEENLFETLKKDGSELSYYTTSLATSIWPMYNRFLHGIYPFVTGANFVVSYAYRDSLVDPYDDMDFKANYPYIVGTNDYLLTYPTWQGDILPTLCYEALREGIEDSELISTLQALAEKALQNDDNNIMNLGKEADHYLDGVLKRVNKNFKQEYYRKRKVLIEDPMEKAILKDLNNGQSEEYAIFDKIRHGVCNRIIALQSVLTQSN